jgi:hypothetical protein
LRQSFFKGFHGAAPPDIFMLAMLLRKSAAAAHPETCSLLFLFLCLVPCVVNGIEGTQSCFHMAFARVMSGQLRFPG